VLGVAATLQHLTAKHADLLKGVLTHSERKLIASFVQSPEDYFDAEPTFKQSYAPQSGEIFGILGQMKETFEKDLSDSQKAEAANVKAYEDLKAAKEAEIQAGQAQIDKKTQELADTDERLAHSKEDIEDTKNALSADEQFLMMLKEKCSMTDSEWEERQKTRAMEMEAREATLEAELAGFQEQRARLEEASAARTASARRSRSARRSNSRMSPCWRRLDSSSNFTSSACACSWLSSWPLALPTSARRASSTSPPLASSSTEAPPLSPASSTYSAAAAAAAGDTGVMAATLPLLAVSRADRAERCGSSSLRRGLAPARMWRPAPGRALRPARLAWDGCDW